MARDWAKVVVVGFVRQSTFRRAVRFGDVTAILLPGGLTFMALCNFLAAIILRRGKDKK